MKKILTIVIFILIMSTCVVFAASVNGQFNGFPIANTNIGGKEIKSDVPGIVMKGRTLLPARLLAENLNAIVEWDKDTMTANIIKPEVQLIFVDYIEEVEGQYWNLANPYCLANKGVMEYFTVYYEVTNLDKKTVIYKIVVYDTDDKVIDEITGSSNNYDGYGIAGCEVFQSIPFDKVGNYRVELQMLHGNDFYTVGTKNLYIE